MGALIVYVNFLIIIGGNMTVKIDKAGCWVYEVYYLYAWNILWFNSIKKKKLTQDISQEEFYSLWTS